MYGARVTPSNDREVLSPWPVAGLVGLACVAFLIGASQVAVRMPWWALLGLAASWVLALALALAWFTKRPRSVVLLPVGVALVWFVTVIAGARWAGWGP